MVQKQNHLLEASTVYTAFKNFLRRTWFRKLPVLAISQKYKMEEPIMSSW